jgi:CheY-like chemotaxis protein
MRDPMSPYQSSSKTADILLVEDNPGDVLLFSEFLKETKMPYTLHVAEDGEEADKLDIAKSTLSGILRCISKKLIYQE